MFQNQPDLFALGRTIARTPVRLITGHVPIQKYLALSRLDRVVVFFRDPVQRVVSEWQHHCRHHGCSQSLAAFVREPDSQNVQARLMGDVPLELVGFNLITERYQRSLEFFNKATGMSLQAVRVNQNESKNGERYELSRDDEKLILEFNQGDVKTYDKACRLFDERAKLLGDVQETGPTAGSMRSRRENRSRDTPISDPWNRSKSNCLRTETSSPKHARWNRDGT